MFVLLSGNPTWLENPSHDICWCLKARGFACPEWRTWSRNVPGRQTMRVVLRVLWRLYRTWCTLELNKPFGLKVSFEDINVFDYWSWGDFFLLWFNFSAWSLQASTEVLKQRHQDLDQQLAVWMPFPTGGMVKRWGHWLGQSSKARIGQTHPSVQWWHLTI